MAKITNIDILKLAKLAQLDLTDEEINKFQKEISEILGYVEQLQNVDVKGLKPTYQVTGLKNVTRKDEIIDYGASQADLLKNVPELENKQIKVRRVL